MKSVFLTDIDGTLVRRDVPLPDAVVAAAHDYTAQGGLLAVCTGRSVVAAQEIAQRLGVNLPCILYCGASLYDFQARRHVFLHPFRCDILSSVASVLERHPQVSMQVFSAEEIYVLRRNARLDARGVREENTGPLRHLSEVRGDIIKLVMCCDDPQELSACQAYFPSEFCDFAFASRNFADIVAAGSSKVDAMRALSRAVGIPLKHFLAAGDAMTDLPMLRLAGTSFAPANAIEEVKAAVHYTVPDVSSAGMAAAFALAAAKIII